MDEAQDKGGFVTRKNRGNIRKRPQEDISEAEEPPEPGLVKVAKAQKAAPLAFSTKQEGSRRPVTFAYDSSATLQQATDDGATKTLETETEFDRDARARRERVLSQATAGPSADDSYKGINNYVDHKKGFRREHTIGAEKGSGMHGPLRASAHIRTTIRFDYQPDICKDYKETGYCGYGDACKFVHDRSDYKSGWELEREWDAREKRLQEAKWEGVNEEQEGEEDDDDLPFACYICRRPWTNVKDPVVTRCKHYFCEQCALKHNATANGKCAACEQPTNGIFNVATDVLKKVKEQKSKDDSVAG